MTEPTQRDPQTYALLGAAMEVHRELGHGFLEAVYQDALAIELGIRDIPFQREQLLPVLYKGRILPSFYRADFVCFESVLVECKALTQLSSNEMAQVINYLRVTGIERALLINFGQPNLQYKRLVVSNQAVTAPVS